jgi:hypothetical protein
MAYLPGKKVFPGLAFPTAFRGSLMKITDKKTRESKSFCTVNEGFELISVQLIGIFDNTPDSIQKQRFFMLWGRRPLPSK